VNYMSIVISLYGDSGYCLLWRKSLKEERKSGECSPLGHEGVPSCPLDILLPV